MRRARAILLGTAVRKQLDPSNRLDPTDPEQHKQLLELLREGEQLLTRGAGGDSELAIRAKIREASSIFVHGKPGAEELRRSLADLEESLDWARRHGVAIAIRIQHSMSSERRSRSSKNRTSSWPTADSW